jgi:sugar phosphate isomerase/epimerase
VGFGAFCPAVPLDPWQLLDFAQMHGCTYLQLCDNLPLEGMPRGEVGRFANAAWEAGVTLGLGTRGVEPEHLARWLRLAKHFGAADLRTLLDSEDSHPTPDEAATWLKNAIPAYEEAGVMLNVENHNSRHAAELKAVMAEVGPSLGVCLDTANSLGIGETFAEVVSLLEPYAACLHIKEHAARRLDTGLGFCIQGRSLGHGDMNQGAVMSLLEKHPGIKVVLEQWPPQMATLEDTVRQEYEWAKAGVETLSSWLGL